jgi:hypothetical protein
MKEEWKSYFGKFKSPPEFPRLAAFANLMDRLWFTRVWVVQELALAAEAVVFCGNSSIEWTDLMNAITAQDHLNLHLANHDRNAYAFILEKARKEWSSGAKGNLLSILFRYRILDATDPRDKIFGLSALFQQHEQSGSEALQPDYSIDTAHLYITVAKRSSSSLRTSIFYLSHVIRVKTIPKTSHHGFRIGRIPGSPHA